MGAGGQEDQSVGVIETQLLHLVLVLLEGICKQGSQGHYPLLTSFGCAPNMISGGIPITLEGLINQYLTFYPVDTIPSQSPDFCISHSRAYPQQKEWIKPFLFYLEVTLHCLNISSGEHITLH